MLTNCRTPCFILWMTNTHINCVFISKHWLLLDQVGTKFSNLKSPLIRKKIRQNHLIDEAGFSSHPKPIEAGYLGLRSRHQYFYHMNQMVLRKTGFVGRCLAGLTDILPAGGETNLCAANCSRLVPSPEMNLVPDSEIRLGASRAKDLPCTHEHKKC